MAANLATLIVIFGLVRLRTGSAGSVEDPRHKMLLHMTGTAANIVGAGYGAYLGAPPYQRARSMYAAMTGAAAVNIPLRALGPDLPTIIPMVGGAIAAAAGAAIGASGAR